MLDVGLKQEAREKAGHRLVIKFYFHIHSCLLSKFWSRGALLHAPELKQKSFIHIWDEGRLSLRGTTRFRLLAFSLLVH